MSYLACMVTRETEHSRGEIMRAYRALALSAALAVACLPVSASDTTAQTAPREEPGVVAASAFEVAELYPVEFPSPAPDLLLEPEGEKQAEALARFVEGIIHEETGESDEALEAYRKVLEVDPGFSGLATKVATELIRRSGVPEAIEVLKDTIAASPDDPRPHLDLAYIYARNLRKPDLAAKYANKAMEIDPTDFAPYQTLYQIYMASGKVDLARQTLDKAGKLDSGDSDFWVRLGELYIRLFFRDKDELAPEELEKVNAIYRKALELGSDDPVVLNRVADYFGQTRQVKQAIPLYLKILELQPPLPDRLVSSIREKLAESFLLNNQRHEAIKVLEEMIRVNPLRYGTYEFLGTLYEEEGNLEKAAANYESSLLLNPNQPANYLRVADIFLRLRQFDRAVKNLREARRRFPDLPQITYSLAISLSQAGSHGAAMSTFEAALIEARNTQEEIVNGTFYFNYGAAAEQAGLYEKAASLFRKAIDLDPANAAPALNYLGYMWVDRGENLDEAGDLIRRALDIDPENGAYIDSLGWLYYKQGDYEKALIELLRAADHVQPEDPVVYEHIGDTYKALRNVAQALIYWRKALALDPQNKNLLAKIGGDREAVVPQDP